jgi:hypothetical protein
MPPFIQGFSPALPEQENWLHSKSSPRASWSYSLEKLGLESRKWPPAPPIDRLSLSWYIEYVCIIEYLCNTAGDASYV